MLFLTLLPATHYSQESFDNQNNEISNPELKKQVERLRGDDKGFEFQEPIKSIRAKDKSVETYSYDVPRDCLYTTNSDGTYEPKYDSYKGTTDYADYGQTQTNMIILFSVIGFVLLIILIIILLKRKKDNIDFTEIKK
jgi:LPXTG-motif cell wall-anchored protein